MLTKYDDIWQCMLDNCWYNKYDIPTSPMIQYAMINNAKDYYNNIMQKYKDDYQVNLECDNTNETINVKLTSDELLIYANIMKLIFLKNKLSEFISIYSTFTKELGINNYKSQVDAKKQLVEEQQISIVSLIQNGLTNWEV